MSDTSAHEAAEAQREIERLGFDTSDVCMLPDCGCDGTPHDDEDYCGCCGGLAAEPPKGEHTRCCQDLHDEPTRTCADGHALTWDTEHYDTPRWVHATIADLMACTAWAQDYGHG